MRAARVVDQDVNNIRFGARPPDKFFNAGGFGHVQRVNMGLARARLPGFSGDGFEAVQAPRAQEQFAMLRAKRARRSSAKSTRSARDQNRFAGQ
jgi:hypothetical protein